MPKKRTSRQQPDNDPWLDVSSLIDVSFLLLIFFLVTSTLIKPESDLGVEIPADEAVVVEQPPVTLEIEIAADGRITLGGRELAGPAEPGEPGKIDAVRDELVEHKRRADLMGDTALVSLRSSNEATTQRFVDVINALASAGIGHIAMAGDLALN